MITNNKKIVFKSKFGNIRIISVKEKITSLDFTKSNLYPSSSDFLNKAKIQIEEYILGIRDQFSLTSFCLNLKKNYQTYVLGLTNLY